jgi:hypothetical protein
MRLRGVVGGSVLAAGLVFAGSARAQNVGASIQGAITDSSGQAIQGARVTVRNVATGDSASSRPKPPAVTTLRSCRRGSTRSRSGSPGSRPSSGVASGSPWARTP